MSLFKQHIYSRSDVQIVHYSGVFIFVDTLVFQVGALQLEGCSFDGVCLCENQHNSPSVSAIPTCYLAWVLQVCEALHSSCGSLKWDEMYVFLFNVFIILCCNGRTLQIPPSQGTWSCCRYTQAQRGWSWSHTSASHVVQTPIDGYNREPPSSSNSSDSSSQAHMDTLSVAFPNMINLGQIQTTRWSFSWNNMELRIKGEM